MYAVETTKMSSKGQIVVPDAFRKRYGWRQGMTLMLIGVDGGVMVQPLPVPTDVEIEAAVAESKGAALSVKSRLAKAKRSLDKLASLGVTLPVDIEKSGRRMELLRERFA